MVSPSALVVLADDGIAGEAGQTVVAVDPLAPVPFSGNLVSLSCPVGAAVEEPACWLALACR